MEYKKDGRFIELFFDSIPDEKLRESLKICGWRWNKTKRCWSNFLSYENIIFAESICKELNPQPQSKLLEMERCVVEIQDLLVRSNSFYCNAHHKVKDMAAEISVRDTSGRIQGYLVPIAYCESCNTYFLLEETYLELKRRGVIMCQILSFREYRNKGMAEVGFHELNSISPLRKWGYTVSQLEGYSDIQRQAILEDIVDSGCLTRDKVLSYLDFFVRLNQYREGLAVGKWKDDRNYIASYKLGTAKRVRANKIIVIE